MKKQINLFRNKRERELNTYDEIEKIVFILPAPFPHSTLRAMQYRYRRDHTRKPFPHVQVSYSNDDLLN